MGKKSLSKTGFLSFLSLVVLVAGGHGAWAAKTAYLEVVEGRVQILRSGETGWNAAGSALKTELKAGDRVRTSNRARALILMDDGSKIELAPSSVFLVDFLEEKSFGFKLDFGRLRALVSKFRQRSFAVVTPTAVCAVRGTEFEVNFDQSSQLTAVNVNEGVVSVSDLKGNEVLVNQGESVSVNIEGIQGKPSEANQQASAQKSNDQVKAEIKREVGLNMSRESIEAAAVLEMKDAVAKDGKVVIDAFGERVRTESYIARNDSENKVSWVVLNTRDNSFNYGRYDVWAKNSVPEELGGGFFDSLYFNLGSASPANWAVKDQWFMSNAQDYWIQAHSGGNPVKFSDSGFNWFETIFDHGYVAVSEGGQTRLLEHFVPAAGVKQDLLAGSASVYVCNGGPQGTCLDSLSPAIGDSPLYFYDYYDANANGQVGDQGQQLQTIASVSADTLNTAFSAREGYYNDWKYYLDGQFIYGADGSVNSNFDWNSGNIKIHETTQNRYGVATLSDPTDFALAQSGGKDLVITYEDYLIDDDGKILSFADLSQTLSNAASAESAFKNFADKTNFEFATLSPTYASKIDLVMPMRILNALSAEDDRPSS